MSESDFFFTRHTLRPDPPTEHDPALPESKKYKGITEPGVELAKERAKDIIHMIDELSSDGIMFIGGATELERTKSTGEVYGDTLAEHYKDQEETMVFTRSQINDLRQEAKGSKGKVLDSVQETVDNNPDKKIVFVYPLFLKEFSLTPDFINPKTNKRTDYTDAIYKAGGGYENKAAEVLVKSGGKVAMDDKIIEGITPQEIAEKHIQGIKRLQTFAKNFAHDREVVVGIVGHAWTMDALVSYLANNGVAGTEGWDKAGNEMINKTEMGKISIKEDAVKFIFRGKEYEISPELLK